MSTTIRKTKSPILWVGMFLLFPLSVFPALANTVPAATTSQLPDVTKARVQQTFLRTPLTFEANSRELRFSIYRAVYVVLMGFWRQGAFQGSRAEEAFGVVCDDTCNPPEEQDAGRLWCEIKYAPAVPMEFITLRIAVSADGGIEVT